MSGPQARKSCRVVLCAINVTAGSEAGATGQSDKQWLFNYGIRKLQASIRTAPDLADVEVILLDGTKDTDGLAEKILALAPDVLGMSVYVWSLPSLAKAAEKVKRERPDTWIIFGGPSARPQMLHLEPFERCRDFIDGLALGEGEQIIREVVRARLRGEPGLRGIPGVSTVADGKWQEAPRVEIKEIEAFGSVYLHKLLDRDSMAFVETFRGCPLACAFCQWGDMSDDVSRVFSKEYLVDEFHAIKEGGYISAFLLDAGLNLNSRAFKNLTAAEAEVGVFRDIPLDFEVYPSQLREEHLEFISQIKRPNVGLGIQTLDLGVLKSLDRPFKINHLRSVVERLSRHAVVNLEIIMGLPGDTPESFRHTVDVMREFGCHVRVGRCLVLPDALMNRLPQGMTIDYDPVTLVMRSCTGWSVEDFARESAYMAEIAYPEDSKIGRGDGSWWLLPPKGAAAHDFAQREAPAEVRSHVESPAQPEPAPVRREPKVEPPSSAVAVPRELLAALARGLATAAHWTLDGVAAHENGCVLVISTEVGPIQLLVEHAGRAKAYYRQHGPVAVSYIDGATSMGKPQFEKLNRIIQGGSALLGRVLDIYSPPAGPIKAQPQPGGEARRLPVV